MCHANTICRPHGSSDPPPGAVTYGVRWRDAAGNPTDRLWEATGIMAERRIPAGGSDAQSFSFDVPEGVRGPLRVRAVLNYRAASGYLSSLMTTYLAAPVLAAERVEMGRTETVVEVGG